MDNYLNFAKYIAYDQKKYGLNHNEVLVLDFIAAKLIETTVTINGVIDSPEINLSRATLHGVVQSLISKKFLYTIHPKGDRRAKIILLTTLSIKRYRSLNNVLKIYAVHI